MTPREIVQELDKHIVGQDAAKRAVAIALRNRWRRMQVDEPLRQEITPKNILMIGPTGCGKTEIARRLAQARQRAVREGRSHQVHRGGLRRPRRRFHRQGSGRSRREDDARARRWPRCASAPWMPPRSACSMRCCPSPRMMGFSTDEPAQPRDAETRQKFRKMLREGQLDEREIEIELRAMPAGVRDHGAARHGRDAAAAAEHVRRTSAATARKRAQAQGARSAASC